MADTSRGGTTPPTGPIAGITPIPGPAHAPGQLPKAQPMKMPVPPKPAGQIPVQKPPQPKPQNIKIPTVKPMAAPKITMPKTQTRKP